MNFTAKIKLFEKPGNTLKAFATLIVDNTLLIDGWRVIEGTKGIFVAAPSTKLAKPNPVTGRGAYMDTVRFAEETDEENKSGPVRRAAQQAVLDAYHAELKGQRGTPTKASGAPPKRSGTADLEETTPW